MQKPGQEAKKWVACPACLFAVFGYTGGVVTTGVKEHRLISGSIYEIDKDTETLKFITSKMLKDVGFFNLSRRKEIKKQILNMESLFDMSRAKTIDGLSDRLGTL